jgi:pimeloyl-ACP methyl ester carboxylesterase
MKSIRTITLCFLVVLLAGCADSAEQPTATPVPMAIDTAVPLPTETPTHEPAIVEYRPTFEESPCPFALPPEEEEGETVICGYVTVPEVRASPDEATINLAVVVFKALTANAAPDPVILLAGGPGEKTVANAVTVSLILSSFRDKRDLIIFDQRGVGLSEPALECPQFKPAILETLDELDAEVSLRTQFEAIMACRDQLVAEGHNLSAYNTAENAADVEDIRRALGYEQLNLYGGSYGTLLAQTVMRNHPTGIRSVVLGGVLPTEKSFFVHVPTTTVQAVLHLLEVCAADEPCNAAYPNLQETLFDTIDSLNANPVPITVTDPADGQSYDSWLTGDAVFGNLITFLYITDIIPVLPQAIEDVANGDYELMTQLSSTTLVLIDALSRGMEFSVFCAEDLIGVTSEDYLETRLEMPPQLAGATDPEDVIEYGFFGICQNWPVEEADPAIKEPVVSDIPTLILEGEFDPVTPRVYAEEVAAHLSESYLYEFPGVGHNILLGSPCARDIAGRFLEDPTAEPNVSCIDRMPDMEFDLPRAEADEIVLEPVEDQESGFSYLAPAGWEQAAPGTFVRGENSLDQTAIIIDVLPVSAADFIELITARLALEEPIASVGELETEPFNWTLFAEEVQGVAIDIAAVQLDEEMMLMVLLQTSSAEREALYADIFLPVVESVVPQE